MADSSSTSVARFARAKRLDLLDVHNTHGLCLALADETRFTLEHPSICQSTTLTLSHPSEQCISLLRIGGNQELLRKIDGRIDYRNPRTNDVNRKRRWEFERPNSMCSRLLVGEASRRNNVCNSRVDRAAFANEREHLTKHLACNGNGMERSRNCCSLTSTPVLLVAPPGVDRPDRSSDCTHSANCTPIEPASEVGQAQPPIRRRLESNHTQHLLDHRSSKTVSGDSTSKTIARARGEQDGGE